MTRNRDPIARSATKPICIIAEGSTLNTSSAARRLATRAMNTG
jgi:hypothetical protein